MVKWCEMATFSFQLEFRTMRNESALQIDTDLWCLWLMFCWASCGKSVDFGFWKEVVELYKHVHHISSTPVITSEVRISKSGRLRVVWNVFSIASWQKTHVFHGCKNGKSRHLKVHGAFQWVHPDPAAAKDHLPKHAAASRLASRCWNPSPPNGPTLLPMSTGMIFQPLFLRWIAQMRTPYPIWWRSLLTSRDIDGISFIKLCPCRSRFDTRSFRRNEARVVCVEPRLTKWILPNHIKKPITGPRKFPQLAENRVIFRKCSWHCKHKKPVSRCIISFDPQGKYRMQFLGPDWWLW